MPVPGGTTRRSSKAVWAQQLVALAVALELALDVECERVGGAVAVDLDGVVDHEVGGHERVDSRRVATELGHGVAHRRQVHHGRHAGEVLHDDPGRHKRYLDGRGLGSRRDTRPPGRERRHVRLANDAVAGMPQDVLQQDLDRDRHAVKVDAGPRQGGEAIEVGHAGAE